MTKPSLTRFAALALGVLLISSTVSRTTANLVSLEETSLFHLVVVVLAPILFNVFLAWLLFNYARRIDLQMDEVKEEKILLAGLKLLGFHLILLALPALTSALFISSVNFESEDTKWHFLQNAFTSAIEIALGYVLIWHTPRLMNLGSQLNGR